MEYIDPPKQNATDIVDPETALLTGRLKTTDITELLRFQQAFPLDPRKVVAFSKRMQASLAEKGIATPKEKAALVFNEFLPGFFNADRAGGWRGTLHFKLPGAGDYTVTVADGESTIAEGLQGTATAEVMVDLDTLTGILKYGMFDQANQLEAAGFVEPEETDMPLGDEMLDAVVGGRSQSNATEEGCAAFMPPEGDGGDCGIANCLMDGPQLSYCSDFVCGYDQESIMDTNVCGREACGVAVNSGVEACGADACGVDLCQVDACAADACGIDLIPFVPGI